MAFWKRACQKNEHRRLKDECAFPLTVAVGKQVTPPPYRDNAGSSCLKRLADHSGIRGLDGVERFLIGGR